MNRVLFFLLGGLATVVAACGTMRQSAQRDTTTEVAPPRLWEIDDWQPYIGKTVQLRGTICDFEQAHMLYTTWSGKLTYVCLDVAHPSGQSYQLLAYTQHPTVIRNSLATEVHPPLTGTLVEVSGAGKGGGTHREYAILMQD